MKRIFLLLFLIPTSVFGQVDTTKVLHTIDSLKQVVKSADDTSKAIVYNQIGSAFAPLMLLDSIELYRNKALEYALRDSNYFEAAGALEVLGLLAYMKGDLDKALADWESRLEYSKRIDNKPDVANALIGIGAILKQQSKYDKAIERYQEAIGIQQELKDTIGMLQTYSNIGNIHFYFGENYEKAYQFFTDALALAEKVNDSTSLGSLHSSIALVFQTNEEHKKAIKDFELALKIFRDLNDIYQIAMVKSNSALSYAGVNEYQKALEYAKESYEIFRKINRKRELVSASSNLATVYRDRGNYVQALYYFKQSLELTKEIGLPKEIADLYKDISEVYEKQGSTGNALQYYKMYSDLKDSIFNEDTQKQINELETKFNTQQKEKEAAEAKADLLQSKTEVLKQKSFRNMFIAGFIVVLVVALWFYNRFIMKKRANESLAQYNIEILKSKDEIEAKSKEILKQSKILEKQNKQIRDSIMYAQKIQQAVLPPKQLFDINLASNFILFKPRDIVSGDFYWMTTKDGKVIIAAADCTGHGVPGAFMSMLGVSFLNEIVNSNDEIEAHQILNQLRKQVKSSLRQTGKEGEAKDGMDIALCVIDKKNMELEYAGAYNPLILIRKTQTENIFDIPDENTDKAESYELIQVKADKMPIGIYIREKPTFTKHTIEIMEGDSIYLFSDGIVDQFGWKNGRKFMMKHFKDLLLSIQEYSMAEQRAKIEEAFFDWKGSQDQIDDIVVLGIKI